MAKGKKTCKILKEIRKQIAAENDIEFVTSECTYKGDCLGTCPKCESEVRYLERELEKRQRMGKVAVFAGVSLGTMFSATSCDSTEPMTRGSLAGDVVAVRPEPDTLIEEPLMGIVPLFRMNYEFGAKEYQDLMKGKFVFLDMENLLVEGGNIEYEKVAKGEVCDTFEKLVEGAEKFEAPYYPGGEQFLLEDIAFHTNIDVDKFKGDMEVVFAVDRMGKVLDVEVRKGIDKALDEEVASFLKGTEWHPACCQLKDEKIRLPFDCRCALKIHFPLDIVPVPLQGEPPIPVED